MKSRACVFALVSPTVPCSSQPYFTGISAPSSAFSTKRMGSLGLGLRSNRPFDGLRAMSTLAGGGDGTMKVLYDGKCPICLFEIKVLPLRTPPFPSPSTLPPLQLCVCPQRTLCEASLDVSHPTHQVGSTLSVRSLFACIYWYLLPDSSGPPLLTHACLVSGSKARARN